MLIPEPVIMQCQQLYRKQYGIECTRQEALDIMARLSHLYEIVQTELARAKGEGISVDEYLEERGYVFHEHEEDAR